MSCFNGQTSPQNSISKNSLASISVISILKDRISCLQNELPKKNTIIDFLSKQLSASKHNTSQYTQNT